MWEKHFLNLLFMISYLREQQKINYSLNTEQPWQLITESIKAPKFDASTLIFREVVSR